MVSVVNICSNSCVCLFVHLCNICFDAPRSSWLWLVYLLEFVSYETKLWGQFITISFRIFNVTWIPQGEWVGPGDVCIHDKLYSMIILIIILIIIITIILLIFFIFYTMDTCMRSVKKRNERRKLRKYTQFGSEGSSLTTSTGFSDSKLINWVKIVENMNEWIF